jgi:hypothetical protein
LEENERFSPLRSLIGRQYSFQKLIQFWQGHKVLHAPASNFMIFFWEIHVLLQLSWIVLPGTKWAFLTLENLIGRQSFFQKQTHFWQKNNTLDAPPANVRGFLTRDTCVSSSQLNIPIWSKHRLSQRETPMWQEVFLWKTSSIPTGNNVLDAPASNIVGLFCRYKCVYTST